MPLYERFAAFGSADGAPDFDVQFAGLGSVGFARLVHGGSIGLGGFLNEVSQVITDSLGITCTVDENPGLELTIGNPGPMKVITSTFVRVRTHTTGLTGLDHQTIQIQRLNPDDTLLGGVEHDMDPLTADRKYWGYDLTGLTVSGNKDGVFTNTKLRLQFPSATVANQTQSILVNYVVQDVIP